MEMLGTTLISVLARIGLRLICLDHHISSCSDTSAANVRSGAACSGPRKIHCLHRIEEETSKGHAFRTKKKQTSKGHEKDGETKVERDLERQTKEASGEKEQGKKRETARRKGKGLHKGTARCDSN